MYMHADCCICIIKKSCFRILPACCLAVCSSDSMKEFISVSSSFALTMDTARVRMRRVNFILYAIGYRFRLAFNCAQICSYVYTVYTSTV